MGFKTNPRLIIFLGDHREMKIKKLMAENVLKLKVVDITPDENNNLIVIGGKNGRGKTSVLRSIEMALDGKKALAKRTVRDGQENAQIVLDLGDIIITRQISSTGESKLIVKNATGLTYPTPQSLLSSLFNRLTFDPLSFMRQGEKEQLNTLKELVGVSTDEIDAQRQQFYNERTEINTRIKNGKAYIERLPEPAEDTPADYLVFTDIDEKLSSINGMAQSKNNVKEAIDEFTRLVQKVHGEIVVNETDITSNEETIIKLKEEIENCEASIGIYKKNISDLNTQTKEIEAKRDAAKNEYDKMEIPDAAQLLAEKKEREETNKKVLEREQFLKYTKELEALKLEAQNLTDLINQCDRQKADKMGAAKWPVDGLGYDDTGVIFKGVPFSQCSSAEQLRISCGMGLAANPDLNIMLIRDGSLLDDESLILVGEIAKNYDAQVWIERVSEGEEVNVLIEDGTVKTERYNGIVVEPKIDSEGIETIQ